MGRRKTQGVDDRLELGKILQQAKHRWLRPAEVCEVIRNYTRVGLSHETANMPPSGMLFLYDRKVLRCFRRDGHRWKKPKDGNAVKEPHAKLKVKGVGALHCYYAHGEENENFQKRSYSMVEQDLSHIVVVHYRELESIRTSFNDVKDTIEVVPPSNETQELAPAPEMQNCISFSSNPNGFQVHSQPIDAASLNTAWASEFKNAKSAYNHQASLQLQPFLELQQPMAEKTDAESSDAYCSMAYSKNQLTLLEAKHRWLRPAEICEILQNYEKYHLSSKPANMAPGGSLFLFNRKVLRHFRKDGHNWRKKKDGKAVREANEKLKGGNNNVLHCYYAHGEENKNFQRRIYSMLQEGLLHIVLVHYLEVQTSEGSSNCPMDQSLHYDVTTKLHEGVDGTDLLKSLGPLLMDSDKKKDLQFHLPNTDTISKRNNNIEGKADQPSAFNPVLEGSLGDGLKNCDSLIRWMSEELEDVDEPQMQFSSGAYWDTVGSEEEVDKSSVPLQVRSDSYMLGPSLSHDQLFSIFDFSPNWAYENSVVKVSITGIFLKIQHTESCKWSCMFREVEVPAEVVADGVLHCYTPIHKAGRVPFYITCSNRLACSEVREFEYRVPQTQDVDIKEDYSDCSNETLSMRFGKLLSLSSTSPSCDPASIVENSELNSKITSMLQKDNNEWDKLLQLTSDEEFSLESVEEQLLQEKLHAWLFQKLAAGGRGPSVLDEGGQGVLHFGAALGYDWVLLPTVTAGVSVNFRDVNGWTALHWAAFCGREHIVTSLISLGAALGELTFPTTEYPTGETPMDVASGQGHKRIAGYLAESALSAYLSSLNLDIREGNSAEMSGAKAVSRSSRDRELADRLLLMDSLTTVCNYTQAAAHTHQVLRVQAFQRKQYCEKSGISNEYALSLKPGKLDEKALSPMKLAGLSVDFRDINGWTALHWAAFNGREHMVAMLIILGATPGALTDPCTKCPTGKTPADLASEQGHIGIAGYLAESSLNTHLSFLKSGIKDSAAIFEAKSVQRVPQQISAFRTDGLSLRACLVAVNNATQVAARIVQSIPWKQLKEYSGDKFGISDERALSRIAIKSCKAGKPDENVEAAAILIQNRFRDWKCRKGFSRQRIVKNQARVRDHQEMKSHGNIVWAVGILEKIILRWRRKRHGLRGFKPEPLRKVLRMQGSSSKDSESDYDFIMMERKQTEERVFKELAHVKSMVQYPEARDQYIRLLNVVTEIQETKVKIPDVENGSTSVRSTFDSQQESCVEVDMKSFDPTNGLNELLENRIGVFTLKVLRPEYDCELLSFIFTKSIPPDDHSYILVKTNTNFLTRDMVWLLQPDGWLNGDVINVFAEYLWLGGSKHDFYFPTLFSQKVDIDIGRRNKKDMDPTEFAKWTRKVAGLKKFDKHISHCKKIFVPLHDVNHWYLLVVHIDSQVAEIWDSLNPTQTRCDHCKDVLEALDILYDKVEFQLQKKNKFSYYQLREGSKELQCPRQVGGSDCGVYVVRHMQRYGKEWWHEFDSQEQRMDLAIELVRNRFNLAWKDVSAAAKRTASRNCSKEVVSAVTLCTRA